MWLRLPTMSTDRDKATGLECPHCGCRHFLTRNTIPLRDGRIKRYKVCRHCGRVTTTFEGTTKQWAN